MTSLGLLGGLSLHVAGSFLPSVSLESKNENVNWMTGS